MDKNIKNKKNMNFKILINKILIHDDFNFTLL